MLLRSSSLVVVGAMGGSVAIALRHRHADRQCGGRVADWCRVEKLCSAIGIAIARFSKSGDSGLMEHTVGIYATAIRLLYRRSIRCVCRVGVLYHVSGCHRLESGAKVQ